MTDGQRNKLKRGMAIAAEASKRATQRGTNFSSEQALIYTTMSATMHWVMGVLGEEPQNHIFDGVEQALKNAQLFKVLPDDFKG